VLTVIVACIVTRAVDRIETAFLAVGALSVLRFRTVMKDAREFTFIFLAIAAGIGVGTKHYDVVVFGTLFSAVLTYGLHAWQYGRHKHPPYLKAQASDFPHLRDIIEQHTVKADLIDSQKVSGAIGTFRFEIVLPVAKAADQLLQSLLTVTSVNEITLTPWKRSFGSKDSDDS
jgi:hypothetical protein